MQLGQTYPVDPRDIKLTMHSMEFDTRTCMDAVQDGDWDLDPVPFEVSIPGTLYRSLKQIQDGATWDETEYWEFLRSSVAVGENHCGVASLGDLHTRCYKWMQSLVDDVRTFNKIPDRWNERDHIGVNIDRDGRMILNNGRHRFGVALFFGIPQIEVQVNVRHAKWVAFKNQVGEYAKGHGGAVYAPVDHMDLGEYPSCHSGRIEAIAKHLVGTTVLDIGAHWGHCCQHLSRLGKRCLAVENSADAVYFMQKLRTACGADFGIFKGDVFDLEDTTFDSVLALRIFHHFLKNQGSHEKLVAFLGKLKTSEMFFQPHDPAVQNMTGAYRNYEEADFVNFIIENSCLTSADKIGQFIGGPIYRIHV